MTELLDSQLVYDLRDVINKTDIFVKDPIEKEKFDLICAIMDRFDLSVDFLNKHQSFPKDENEFINFLVHVSIIRDGINAVFKELGLEIKSDNKIFEEYYKMDLPNINKTINDDKFYEYFRNFRLPEIAFPSLLYNNFSFFRNGLYPFFPHILRFVQFFLFDLLNSQHNL